MQVAQTIPKMWCLRLEEAFGVVATQDVERWALFGNPPLQDHWPVE